MFVQPHEELLLQAHGRLIRDRTLQPDTVAFELGSHSCFVNTKYPGGLAFVPSGSQQRLGYQPALKLLNPIKQTVGRNHRRLGSKYRSCHLVQITFGHRVRHDFQPVNGIVELPDIPRPVMGQKLVHQIGRRMLPG